jgi:hypothetical protein
MIRTPPHRRSAADEQLEAAARRARCVVYAETARNGGDEPPAPRWDWRLSEQARCQPGS